MDHLAELKARFAPHNPTETRAFITFANDIEAAVDRARRAARRPADAQTEDMIFAVLVSALAGQSVLVNVSSAGAGRAVALINDEAERAEPSWKDLKPGCRVEIPDVGCGTIVRVIRPVGAFLDPVVVVLLRADDGTFRTLSPTVVAAHLGRAYWTFEPEPWTAEQVLAAADMPLASVDPLAVEAAVQALNEAAARGSHKGSVMFGFTTGSEDAAWRLSKQTDTIINRCGLEGYAVAFSDTTGHAPAPIYIRDSDPKKWNEAVYGVYGEGAAAQGGAE